MEVSNKKTTIVLIVGIIIILGAYFGYKNIDKIKKAFLGDNYISKENNTKKEEKDNNDSLKEDEIKDVYECPEGYFTEEENVTESTICYMYIELTEGDYACPEGSSPKYDGEISYATTCYYKNDIIAPNSCTSLSYDNGSKCVSNTATSMFNSWTCISLDGVWKEDGCHTTSPYICPDGYITYDFNAHGVTSCIRYANAEKNYYCSEGTYDSTLNKCVLSINANKKDI